VDAELVGVALCVMGTTGAAKAVLPTNRIIRMDKRYIEQDPLFIPISA
jgi:hypothetical protein